MPISFNPVHYIALGSIIFNVVLVGYSWTIKTQLLAAGSKLAAFVAESDAKASAQIAKNVIEIAKRDKITTELTKENEKLQTNLAARYAEYRRLLHAQAGSGRVSALPGAAEGIAKPEYETRLNRALGQLEARVLSELAESRDSAIIQSNMCADWLSQQNVAP